MNFPVRQVRSPSRVLATLAVSAMVVLFGLLIPLHAYGARTVTSATLNGGSSVTVAPSTSITAVVNVTTTGSGTAARWRSTGWLISTTAPGTVTCVNHANHDTAGSYSETFSITAPATAGTYNAYFIAYNNDTCSSGASTTFTMTGGVIVTSGLPVATTNAASGVTQYVATLNGTVSSNGSSTTVTFEYGLNTSYGNSLTATQSPLSASAINAAVSADLVGLNCNTPFHYRVVATNSGGTTYGTDSVFTTNACTSPFPATACAATRFGGDLGCTAADISITNIALAPSSISSCVAGAPVTLDLDLTINFSSATRYDVGVFIANDGKLPTLLPANGGAASCSVEVLPITPPPFGYTFPDLDGVPQGTADTCGDGNSSINGGTGSGVKRMTGVTLPCYASAASGGRLFVPFVVSYDNQRSPIGGLCTSNLYPVPNTSSRCNAPASSVSINVVVLPVISKTDGASTIAPGASTTYTITVYNNSGGTLQDSVFKDPAVTDLTVSNVTCTSQNGASCPATSVGAMQGAGILIPSANLPNNSSLIFTVNATLSSGATLGSHLINTATVTIGGNTNSATDDDLIALVPSASKSFSPSTITEGASSLLTITLTNPTGSAVTVTSLNDSYPSGVTNTASPGGATTCTGGGVTAAGGGGSLTMSGGIIPAYGSCTVTVNVTSATAGTYTNSTGTITTGGDPIAAASAMLIVNTPVFGAFNACDVATAPNANCTSTTTVSTSHITTKVAGQAFSLDLVALDSKGSRNTNYSNNVQVQLLDASNNSAALDSTNCRSSWTVITTLSPNPQFTNANNGLITVGPFSVAEAYREVRVKVSNVGGATRVGCSTDNFAIRPNSFTISATNPSTLNNTSASGGVIQKAGQNFTLSASAYNGAGTPAVTAGYSGSPSVSLGSCTGTACTSTFGVLLPSTMNFSSGTFSSSAATYSEAGSFLLTLQDTSFASVDAADTSADCTGAVSPTLCFKGTTSVGRFVPDHFSVSSASLTAACSSFTYLGQSFSTTFTLTAQNAAGGTTQNYAASTGLAKLPLTTWGAAPASTGSPGYGFAVSTWSPSQPSGSSLAAGSAAPTGTWTSGAASVTASHKIVRPASPAAPTTATVTALPVDSDGVTMPSAATLGNSLQRFGILKLDNAYGSELLPLRIPMRAMYWSGSAFVTNGDDSCTSVPTSSIAIGNIIQPVGSSLSPTVSSIQSTGAGTWDIILSQSGTKYTGSADIAVNLTSTGTDVSCNTTHPGSTGANLAWLEGKWGGSTACPSTAYDRDPNARIRFGTSRSPFIYLREMY